MARTSAALLVDSDLKGLEALVYGFQGANWHSTACPALETVAFLAKPSATDILVIASREPHDKTLALLGQLRANQETRAIPLLVMGPSSLRESVLDCGTIDFLPTPVFVRDVITASRILVSLGSEPEPKLDGTLAEFGLFSILRAMSSLMRSGVLQVERAGRQGKILFAEGEVAGAQVGILQGSSAIHHLLLWEDAKVELHLRAVTRRAQFNQRFDQIMDEAERFVRDYSHAIRDIAPSSSVYEKDEAKLAGPTAAIPSEVMPVIRLCDGQRTLADIIDQSPFRVFDTARILTRLVELGLLRRREAKHAPAAPPSPLQKFWETARIAGPEDSTAPVSPPKPAPARARPLDDRIGEPSRRKLQRRATGETPVFGTPLIDLKAAQDPRTGTAESAPLAAPVAQAASKDRASGTIELRAADNRRQPKSDRRARPSVTIDADLVEAAVGSTPSSPLAQTTAGTVDPPARTGRATGTLRVTPSAGSRRSGTALPSAGGGIAIDPGLASDAGARADAPTAATGIPLAGEASQSRSGPVAVLASQGDGARTAKVTGTLSITPSQRNAAARTPGRGVSVQLDPVLVAELDRLEKATTPLGPPETSLQTGSEPMAAPAQAETAGAAPTARIPTSPPPTAGSARVTGTLSVSPSSHSSAHVRRTPTRGSSVALDPALMAEAQAVDAAKPRPGSTSVHGPAVPAGPRSSQAGRSARVQARGASGDGAAPASARTAHHSPDGSPPQPGKSSGRISGAFNAIESDFFAREADLYKGETEDNFSDLDEPDGKRQGKPAPGRGQSKKHA